jgi:alginate biosynthesis protein AlgX
MKADGTLFAAFVTLTDKGGVLCKLANLSLQDGQKMKFAKRIETGDTTAANSYVIKKAFKPLNIAIELQLRLAGKTHDKSSGECCRPSPFYRKILKNDKTDPAITALPHPQHWLLSHSLSQKICAPQINYSRRWAKLGLLCTALITSSLASQAAQYGCPASVQRSDEVFLQGSDGVFFRQKPDLDIFFPLSDRSASAVGHLTRVLAKRGISLVILPIPARGTVMARQVAASNVELTLGFDPAIARASYEAYVGKLRGDGVAVLDLLPVLTAANSAEPLFMKTDHHWTADGAKAAAMALAEMLGSIKNFDDLPKTQFVTKPIAEQLIISNMRRAIQLGCADAVPKNEALATETDHKEVAAASNAVDIFGDDSSGSAIALVGTSFSDVDAFNFDGYISQYSGVDVANFAISGGNQFVSLLSYLTSPAFTENPPKIIVWENPVYNDLGEFGDAPLDEAIAAASGECEGDNAKSVKLTAVNGEFSADVLEMPKHNVSTYMKLDAGNPAVRHATFEFMSSDGATISTEFLRADRFKANGRFFVKLPEVNIKNLRVTAQGSDVTQNTLSLCNIED